MPLYQGVARRRRRSAVCRRPPASPPNPGHHHRQVAGQESPEVQSRGEKACRREHGDGRSPSLLEPVEGGRHRAGDRADDGAGVPAGGWDRDEQRRSRCSVSSSSALSVIVVACRRCPPAWLAISSSVTTGRVRRRHAGRPGRTRPSDAMPAPACRNARRRGVRKCRRSSHCAARRLIVFTTTTSWVCGARRAAKTDIRPALLTARTPRSPNPWWWPSNDKGRSAAPATPAPAPRAVRPERRQVEAPRPKMPSVSASMTFCSRGRR